MNHDQLFKLMMHLLLKDFFEVFFPEWAGRFLFGQAEWLEQEIFPEPPRGEKLVVDMLVRLPTVPADPPRENEPRDSLALLLIEAENSTGLADFRERMYNYTVSVAKKYDLDVLPVAIFLKLRLDGRGTDVVERRFWERRILTFEYDYVALPGLRAEDYAGHPNPLAVAWSTVMTMERDRRASAAVAAMDAVVASDATVEKKHALLGFIQSYAPLEDDQRRDLNELLTDPKHERVMAMGKTWFQEGLEKGLEMGKTWFQEGMEKGLEIGQTRLQEGIEQERLRLVLDLCQSKFAQLSPENTRRKLEQLSMAQLKELSVKLLVAQTPQEVGLAE